MSNTFDDATKTRLVQRMDRLSPDTQGLWGRMSVTQMLTHMNDAFKISLGMKPAVDKSNFFTHFIMFPAAIYLLPAFPKNAVTASELNPLKEGSKSRDFYTELEFLKKMVDIFNEREEAKLKPHPMFGKLSKKQWRDLFTKHLDHHLRQFGV